MVPSLGSSSQWWTGGVFSCAGPLPQDGHDQIARWVMSRLQPASRGVLWAGHRGITPPIPITLSSHPRAAPLPVTLASVGPPLVDSSWGGAREIRSLQWEPLRVSLDGGPQSGLMDSGPGNPFTCRLKHGAWAPVHVGAAVVTPAVTTASPTRAYTCTPSPPRIHLARVSQSPCGYQQRVREVGAGAGAKATRCPRLPAATPVLSFL